MEKPKWLGEEPQFDEASYNEVVEADVVVLGAGLAGVAAIRAAAEEGATVVVFEKCFTPQGRSGQFCLVGGEFIKRWGVDNGDKVNEIVSHLMCDMNYRVKQRILNRVISESGPAMDWYMNGLPKEGVFVSNASTDVPTEGTKLHIMKMREPGNPDYDLHSERFPTYPYTIQFRPSHVPVLRNNMQIAIDTGRVKVYYKTPAKKLLKDESGRIVGAVAQDYDGKIICAKAKKGVILATGDYSGDDEIMAQYCPNLKNHFRVPFEIAPDKKRANTGDGHRMAMWVGAKMEPVPHAVNVHNMGGSMGVTPFLQLDLNGERFMNEDCTGQMVENQIEMLREQCSWQFYDSAWPDEIKYMPDGHGNCTDTLDDDAVAAGKCFDDLLPMDGYASWTYIEKSVAEGKTLKADTLEELVEKIGLPKEQAMASLLRYNELCHKGNDDDFGKRSDRMFALEHGPFYATKITLAALLCAHGGFESDEECRCYDENRNPIPGLYVVGNIQGNRLSVDYPTTIPGLSHTMCLTLGRVAGRNAAHGLT